MILLIICFKNHKLCRKSSFAFQTAAVLNPFKGVNKIKEME